MSRDPAGKFAPHVVISGYYGFGNIGDEAVLAGIVESLRTVCPSVQITALSATPETTAEALGIEAVNRNHWGSIKRTLRQADLLISGGGSLLQDVTSALSPLYYLNVIRLGLQTGIAVMIYAQGFGPLRRRFNRWIARRLLRCVDCITVRDAESAKALQELGVDRSPILITADPAFCLSAREPDQGKRALAKLGIGETDRPLVGVSLRPWKGMEAKLPTLAEVLRSFAASTGCRYVFLPMQFPADCPPLLTLAAEVTNSSMLNMPLQPGEMLGVIGEMDFVIGMRLHALMFGVMMGVPMLGIGYDPKVEAFGKTADIPVVSWEKITDEFAPQLVRAWESRREQKEGLTVHRQRLREAALANATRAMEIISRRAPRSLRV